MENVRVKIIRSCFSGGILCAEGEEISLPEDQAKQLLRLGRAVPAGEQHKEKPAARKKN